MFLKLKVVFLSVLLLSPTGDKLFDKLKKVERISAELDDSIFRELSCYETLSSLD